MPIISGGFRWTDWPACWWPPLFSRQGGEAARDTLDPLLGRPMDPELAADIDRIVLGHDHILGIHDLVYHDYGPVEP